jgi:ubiquinone/menaquinone biosynthesis C-methylase UbiE
MLYDRQTCIFKIYILKSAQARVMCAVVSEQNNVREYFNDALEFYDRSYIETDAEASRFFFFEEGVLPKYIDRVISCIDLGCGSGIFLNYIKKKYGVTYVFGLDISESMLTEACKHKDGSVELAQGSILDLPFDDKKFDLVYMDDVLHHIVSERRNESKRLAIQALENIKRITKPNGIFILREQYYESYLIQTISSHTIMFLLNLFNSLGIKLPHKEAHIGLLVTFYTRKELQQMIEEVGGRIIELDDRKWRKGLMDYLALVKSMGKTYFVIDFPDFV